jgi:hypothetical protein
VTVPPLVDPEAHEPLADAGWDEGEARAAIGRIAADAEEAFAGKALWPVDAADLEGPERGPLRMLYCGAAGVLLALDVLQRTGHVELRRDYGPAAAGLHAGYLASPDDLDEPLPGLMVGEAGILLVADRLAPSAAGTERLLEVVRGNARNAANDLVWGAPGTMLAAREMVLRHGDERFAEAWRASARILLSRWHQDLWQQRFGRRRQRYVGPGHGFAMNVRVLLQGRELLGEERAAAVEERALDVLPRLAILDGDVAQWPPLGGRRQPEPRTQWCHGAPGMVISFADVRPDDAGLTQLLEAGGELTWRAGPLRKGPGLCHGTAGNAYAFLALHRRTGHGRWLERAQRFLMHAVGQVERRREERGRGRYSLFTGDLGVALALRACLDRDPRMPGVDLFFS